MLPSGPGGVRRRSIARDLAFIFLTSDKILDRLYLLCGAEGIRTPDLCIANAALSQLSYSPIIKSGRNLSNSLLKVNPKNHSLEYKLLKKISLVIIMPAVVIVI